MTVVLLIVGYAALMIVCYLFGYWLLAPWLYGFKAFTSPKRAATDPTRRRR